MEHEGREVAAVLPYSHLTDTVSLVSTLASSLVVGQKLDCMAWHKDVATLLTRKKSLMESFASSPQTYEDYSEGCLVPGVVRRKTRVMGRMPILGSKRRVEVLL